MGPHDLFVRYTQGKMRDEEYGWRCKLVMRVEMQVRIGWRLSVRSWESKRRVFQGLGTEKRR